MPAATSWVFDPERRIKLARILGYIVIWMGLLVTITRTTIIVCALQVLIYFLMTRRPTRVVGAILITVGVFLTALLLVPGLASFVLATAPFQTSSSYSHLFDWTRGIVAFSEMPWGHGLGSSDQVAARFGRIPITADNMFLGYAVDLGLVGLLCYVTVIFTIAVASWRLFRLSEGLEARAVAATVFLATFGIALNGVSSSPFNSVFLAYNFFILAGAAVTAYQRRSASWHPIVAE
jgi:hypothetical protein